jgi:hypothetical protein
MCAVGTETVHAAGTFLHALPVCACGRRKSGAGPAGKETRRRTRRTESSPGRI